MHMFAYEFVYIYICMYICFFCQAVSRSRGLARVLEPLIQKFSRLCSARAGAERCLGSLVPHLIGKHMGSRGSRMLGSRALDLLEKVVSRLAGSAWPASKRSLREPPRHRPRRAS